MCWKVSFENTTLNHRKEVKINVKCNVFFQEYENNNPLSRLDFPTKIPGSQTIIFSTYTIEWLWFQCRLIDQLPLQKQKVHTWTISGIYEVFLLKTIQMIGSFCCCCCCLFFKFFIVIQLSCVPFLPIPPPNPSQNPVLPPPPPSSFILSMCPL